MVEKFEFTDKLKKSLYIMIGVGVVGILLTLLMYRDNHYSRLWSNILLNAYFFTGIGIFGIFFAAANQLGYSGWITLVKRIYMSLSGFVKIGAIFGLLLVGGVWMGYHHLYDHWSVAAERAELANTKQAFFNPTFWTIRVVVYFVLWIVVGGMVIKAINHKDINVPTNYKRSKLMAALWIVVFAVTESFVSWDLVMSTDPHWYSTLFGWYNFASYGCAAFAFAILLLIYLKSKGYMAQVTENHLHDMGKFMFAFSVFWTYLWFSQFMLQWYGNIPEDTNYWVKRFNVPLFKFTILFALILNFVAPFLLFIKRGAKRNMRTAGFIACVVIVGHYIDFFNMTMFEPNAVAEKSCCAEGEGKCCKEKKEAALKVTTALYAENKAEGTAAPIEAATDATDEKAESKPMEAAKSEGKEECKKGEEECCGPTTYAGLGLPEIMIFVGFLGAFLLMFFTEFAKDSTFNENDPYLKESLRHHVEYA